MELFDCNLKHISYICNNNNSYNSNKNNINNNISYTVNNSICNEVVTIVVGM